MTRSGIAAAAFALLMSSAASAQTNPPPAPGDAPPPLAGEVVPGAPAPQPDPGLAPEAPAGDATAAESAVPPPPMGDDMASDRAGHDESDDSGDWGDIRRDERMAGHHGGRRAGHHGMGGRHYGAEGWRKGRHGRSHGATFELGHGDDGPGISITCADGDTTQECVDAIMPILDKLLPAHPSIDR